MDVSILRGEDGFRRVSIEHEGDTWCFRELSALDQEQILELGLSDYRQGLAMIAASMRDADTGRPYFESIAEGVEQLMHRPAGLLRQVLQHGAAVANRMEDASPES